MIRLSSYILLFIFIFSLPADAQMSVLTDDDLASICSGMGISLWMKDISYSIDIGNIEYTSTDNSNSLSLKNVSVHGGSINPITGIPDGTKHPAYFDSNDDYPLTVDLLTVDEPSSPINGRTFLSVNNPDWTQYLSYSIGNVLFCDKDFGVIEIGNISRPSSYYVLSAHDNMGCDWEYGQEVEIEELLYTYQGVYTAAPGGAVSYSFDSIHDRWTFSDPTTATLQTATESLILSGIHLSGTAGGTESNPATWTFDGPFQIGDFFSGNAATFDVLTRDDNNQTVIVNNVPMNGSFRIEDVDFGGTDFGPVAIDGINIQTLNVEISP